MERLTRRPTTTPRHPDDRALDSAGGLLDGGHYDEAAEFLLRLERRHKAAGDAVEAEILAAARLLCLACRRQRDEMDAQHQARAAEGMERRLRDRVSAILDLAATRALVAPPEPETASRPPPAPESTADAHDVLAVQCLGTFCVLDGSRPLVPWPNRRAKAVLKLGRVGHAHGRLA